MRFTYCPYCGRKLIRREIRDEGEIPYCENCKVPFWDIYTSSVICAVTNEFNEIALLRQTYVSDKGLVCVSGVMKAGESAEETAKREIREELGLKTERLHFIHSYPYAAKEMLMIGFHAEVRKKEFVLSAEVDDAWWVSFKDAPLKMRKGSIAWKLVTEVISALQGRSLSI